MNKCDFCDLETNNSLSFASHLKSCNIVKDNLDRIISEYENGTTLREIIKNYKISSLLINRIFKKYSIHKRSNSESRIGKIGHKHTDETKKKMSNNRKEFLKNNPNKHPWKSPDKFKSIPCEKFKIVLDEINISYIPEMTISNDRYYSIDIAFPEYKIGIEINGNQHYNSNGTLKEYYQKRHEYITSLGWKLYEIHYSQCFDKNKIKGIIDKVLKDKDNIYDFDYSEYLLTKLNSKSKNVCECGKEIQKASKKCLKCNSTYRKQDTTRRKIKNRPSKENLIKDVDDIGYSATGRKYGVSDTSIRKWIKSYEEFSIT